MKLLAIVFAALLSIPAFGQTSKQDIDFINNVFFPATTLLYSQDDQGGMRMRCTATAIDKTDEGYVFVTAAHCSCEDSVDTKTVTPEKTTFFITSDDSDTKVFLKAKLTGCGYRHAGDDFALFTVATESKFPVVPLGKDPAIIEQVANVASPMGLGKQVFLGTISAASLDRPVIADDINWEHAILLQMFGVNGGSSGSALVCLPQKAICGFVVGSIGQTTMTGMPVSRLIKLRADLAAGTYKHWQPDPDAVREKAKK